MRTRPRRQRHRCTERTAGIIAHLGVERALVLTGQTLATKTDLAAKVERTLGAAHAGTFAECSQHVPAGTVDACVAQAKDARADALVVFGGGSPIDTAKMVVRHPVDAGHAAPHQIVIPTTLSAGEFTYAAGMTDETTRVKHGPVDPVTQPGVILYDPELARSTPTELWLTTGIKALDHAIEGLWWPTCHPFLETLRLGAIADLTVHLARSSDPDALEDRLACQHAAWKSIWGLLSARNVGFRLSHPLGHQIGARWDVPHGVTSRISLPVAARFLHERTRDAQAKIARAMGCPTATLRHRQSRRSSIRWRSRADFPRRGPCARRSRWWPRPWRMSSAISAHLTRISPPATP
ncbi:MAG: iron-containing alcohol dehydrogenase [Minwuia sp.]|nr:iron-containing alcohol dehydrogenase [Minwuia sp.]